MDPADPVGAAPARALFGTDGVRGLANREPLTPEMVLRLGQALAQRCRSAGARRPRIVIGTDTRLSGDMLASALSAGICSQGADVLLAGTLPTPAIALLTRRLQADAGAVVSASHNPFQDNGIKLFAHSGFKLPDAAEHEIEQLVLRGGAEAARPTATGVGTVRRIDDAAQRYVGFLADASSRVRLDGLTVAIDCAHGAAHAVGPAVLRTLGAHIVAIGVAPDGQNINRDAGAMHPQRLQEVVVAEHAQLGIALDGDADRALFVDERGEVVDGDEVLAMLAAKMLVEGTLQQMTVVATVMSNIGLEIALRERGARLVRTPVGDRYVVEEMRRHGYNLGGEQSGHLLFLDHTTTGDGLLAALNVLHLMVDTQRPLSELKRAMAKLPQVLVNVPVKQRRDLDTVPPVRQTIERIAATLHDRGRVLVRYSGTELLVRVMVEGEEIGQVRAHADEIAGVIRTHLGA